MRLFVILCLFACYANAIFPVTLGWLGQTTTPTQDAVVNCIESSGIGWESFGKIRTSSLAYFESQFGLPSNGSIFDPETNITTIPDYGYVRPVCMDGFTAQAANIPELISWVYNKRMLVFAFIFSYNGSNQTYGGKFGSLLTALGNDLSFRTNDALVYGYYIIQDVSSIRKPIVKKISMSSSYPSQGAWPWEKHDDLDIYDQQWGFGSADCKMQTYTQSGITTIKTTLLWQFPKVNDMYDVYGL